MTPNITLTVLQSIFCMALFLWIVGLGFSFLFKKQEAYLQWTGQTLQSIWHHGWKFIIGVIVGYWLCGAPFLNIHT